MFRVHDPYFLVFEMDLKKPCCSFCVSPRRVHFLGRYSPRAWVYRQGFGSCARCFHENKL